MCDEFVTNKQGNISNVIYNTQLVKRDIKLQSKTIHRLLKHLEQKELDFVPKFIGITESNHEIVSFVKGAIMEDYPLNSELKTRMDIIKKTAMLLRRYHDATTDFINLECDTWYLSYLGTLEKDVICHNDFAPYNVTFEHGIPIGIIDFDTACPAPRIWDIAYAVYRFIPLTQEQFDSDKRNYRTYNKNIDASERKQLLHHFLNSYSMEKGHLFNAQDTLMQVILRLQALVQLFDIECNKGNEAFLRMKKEGHQKLYIKEIEFIQNNMNDWII